MKKRIGRILLIVATTGGVLVGLYTVSWFQFTTTKALYSFAADDVVAARLDRFPIRPLLLLHGFDEASSPELLCQRIVGELSSRGSVVRAVPAIDRSSMGDDALDRLAEDQGATVVSTKIARWRPFDTVIRIRWTNGSRAEIHEYGFCWSGFSWRRRPEGDQTLFHVVLSEASNLTTRSSGRTRESRPVHGTGRATRRAAERER